MLVIPIQELIALEKCYQKLLFWPHPQGLVCPRCRTAPPTNHFQPLINAKSERGATLYTDESHAYNQVSASDRKYARVNRSQKEYARDEDGDGLCEVHCNTCEGIWTGLRNFLRPFRGVSKHYLKQYTAVFELIYNFKELVDTAINIFLTPDFWLEKRISP